MGLLISSFNPEKGLPYSDAVFDFPWATWLLLCASSDPGQWRDLAALAECADNLTHQQAVISSSLLHPFQLKPVIVVSSGSGIVDDKVVADTLERFSSTYDVISADFIGDCLNCSNPVGNRVTAT
jgi:hypothetical protein